LNRSALALILLLPAALPAQNLAFEVASVKPAVTPEREPMVCLIPCTPGERLSVVGTRVDIRYMSLQRLLLTAFRIKPYQLSGPDWMRSQRFDIAARMPAGTAPERLPELLRALLVERFHLQVHADSKELSVYALVVAKGGPKLQAPPPDADAPLPDTPGTKPLYTPQGEARMLEGGGFRIAGGELGAVRGGRGAGMKFEFLKITMPALAELLAPHLDRPVVDRTNLTGAYYLAAEIHPLLDGGGEGRKGGGREGGREGGGDADSPHDAYGEALFTGIEKAGLKLERTKAAVETIIVDRLDKTPAEN